MIGAQSKFLVVVQVNCTLGATTGEEAVAREGGNDVSWDSGQVSQREAVSKGDEGAEYNLSNP